MIPYWTVAPLEVGGWAVSPIVAYILAAAAVGHFLLLLRAECLGLSRPSAGEFSVTLITFGLLGSHFLQFLFRPEVLRQDIYELFRFSGGLVSAGLIIGALAGGLFLLRWKSREEVYLLADAAAFIFPAPWLLVRFSCFLSHDHIGVASRKPWAVQFPGESRLDLGLLEAMLALVLLLGFSLLDRYRLRPGVYLGVLGVAYSLFRLAIYPYRVLEPATQSALEIPIDISLLVAGVFVLSADPAPSRAVTVNRTV